MPERITKSQRLPARILIVEDEYLVADHLAMMLEDLGYVVIGPVATVEDAFDAVDRESLDGVLLDANLGGVSSALVADALKARSVPFVVCTGYGNLTLSTEVLNVAPRLCKPYLTADLEQQLTSMLVQ